MNFSLAPAAFHPGEAFCVVCRERFVVTPANKASGIMRCQDCMVDGGAGRTRRRWTEQPAPYQLTAKGGNS